MKSYTTFTAIALIAAATIDSAWGLAKYLNELPNGSSFTQALGHPGDDSSKYTDFATAFAAAGHSWTATFCADKFPGASMTNGAAFGDPCCTWEKGGTPDFTVTAFTTTPGKATVCASASSTAGSTKTTDTPATTATPTATTKAPATTTAAPTVTSAPVSTAPATYTAAPATIDAPTTVRPSPGGCRVNLDTPSQNYRRFRH